MRLNVKAAALASSTLWAAAVVVTGLVNRIWPGYGSGFLQLLASIYPGYKASGSAYDLTIGVVYALVDGGIFGLVWAWLYNRFLSPREGRGAKNSGDAGVHYSPLDPP